MSKNDSFTLYLDSAHRTSGTLENPTFNLKKPIRSRQLGTPLKMSIVAIEIPFSFYIVNSSNDTFVYNDGVGDQTITFAHQNYSATELATAIQTAMTAASTGSFTAVYNRQTNKFTITYDAGAFTMLCSDATFTAKKLMGFSTADVASVADAITSVNGVGLSGPNYMLIRSRALQSSNSYDAQNGASQAIARLPLVESAYSIIRFTDTSQIFLNDLSTVQVSEIDLELFDPESNATVDLNGLDWSCEMRFFSAV
jgi:hypothetical protein